ncbi:hypothetical protein V8G54_006425 [Vigna mungo]|uniref:Uncharacterized protein n=1 Tax=Vigna mungo TaxID=3915 RepID=A0AAQ3P3A3_VIGMU
MLQNTQLHALKNPRLLQIQHSPPPKFIDTPSTFHRLFLLQHRHQPPLPPPSPTATCATLPPTRLNLSTKNLHRTDRNFRKYGLRVFIAMKQKSQRIKHVRVLKTKSPNAAFKDGLSWPGHTNVGWFNGFLNTIFFSSPTVALIVAIFLGNILDYKDSAKDKRMPWGAKSLIPCIYVDKSLANVPFIVLGNKNDIPYAASEE